MSNKAIFGLFLWYIPQQLHDWGLASPRFQPQNRGKFLWTVIGFLESVTFQLHIRMLSSQHAHSLKSYRHFSDLGFGIALSHRHVEFFRVKQIHQSTASERTTRLGPDIIRDPPPPHSPCCVYCEHALSVSTVRGSPTVGSLTGGSGWIATANKQKMLVKSQPVAITRCK